MKTSCHDACGNGWIRVHELLRGFIAGRFEDYDAKSLVEGLLGAAGKDYFALFCCLLESFKVSRDQRILTFCPGLRVMQSGGETQNV